MHSAVNAKTSPEHIASVPALYTRLSVRKDTLTRRDEATINFAHPFFKDITVARKSEAARAVAKINALRSDENILAMFVVRERIDALTAGLLVGGLLVAAAAFLAAAVSGNTICSNPAARVGIAASVALLATYFLRRCILLDSGLFAPLSGRDECSEALEFVRNYEVARAIRNDVLVRGRQLYVADFEVMKEARAKQIAVEFQAAAAARLRADCAKLHEVS
ncbi:hypothetical protein F6X40_27475 [Paraburkholderia sp. UCT31]|uniref:hypothetical protein n=1 Tax=Paraburkholderia sp. UCT31 TaxID=2615209 RepID=UPI00165664CD|nr:hypothetical protein [Paraburkholderia sp. UCT31]MBC8740402.1 hypothetical protein [Paraburkholderia sp. UCT31]